MKISKVREYFNRKKIYNITKVEKGTLAIYFYYRKVKVFRIFNDKIVQIIDLLQWRKYNEIKKYCGTLHFYHPKIRGFAYRERYSRKAYYIPTRFLLKTLQNIQMLKKLD